MEHEEHHQIADIGGQHQNPPTLSMPMLATSGRLSDASTTRR
jgi:hypothetical protein